MTVIHSQYREPGKVRIDQTHCTECGLCARICPTETLLAAGGRVTIDEHSLLGCIACGHCMMVCPNGSITVTGRGLSPADLRPLPPPEERTGAGALEALMRGRRSIRRFSPREVEPELLERIVAMAATAPMGVPPWDVGCVVVRGRDRVRALATEIIKGYEGFLKIFRPWVLALMRPFVRQATFDVFQSFIRPLARGYVKNMKEGRDTLFYDAPAVLIFHISAYAEVSDAAIACTYAMLAAESLGLGSTMIGAAAPLLQRNKALSRKIGVPEGNKAAITLIVGHPAARFQRGIERRFSHVAM